MVCFSCNRASHYVYNRKGFHTFGLCFTKSRQCICCFPRLTDEDDGIPPTYIEEVRKPTYLPEGIWEDVLINTGYHKVIDYYIGEEYLFAFEQALLGSNSITVDNEGATITYADINGNNATVIENRTTNVVSIIWNDKEYVYFLTTEILELEELMQYAKSVK